MLLTPGSRSPCASIGATAAPIASPVTNTKTVRISAPLTNSRQFTVGRGQQRVAEGSCLLPTAYCQLPSALCLLLLRDDLEVLVVLVADVFQQFRVGSQHERKRDIPRFRVGARIVDRDEDVHVPEVLAHEALDHTQ